MIRLVQRKLIIPRGDTGNFSLPVPKEANTGDVAVFTIIDPRTNTKVYEKITEPVEQLITIVFTHNDTVNLPVGRYLWDVKFYVNPSFADEKLVNGDEVDSYYAAYTLPECEVRQTGDDLMTSDDSPSSTLTPESLNIITAAITEATQAKNAAAASAAEAQGYVEQITGLSAEAETLPAGASATAAYDAETGVLTLGLPRGDAFSVAKTYPTIVAMNADYSGSDTSVGDFVMIVSTIGDPDNAKLYVKGAERFEFVVDMSGANGVGVQSIVKSGTVENVDTYTITYTDGTTTTYNVVNGVDGDEYTVMVQDTQPTQESNKLWIPTQAGVVQEVPTVQEMNAAIAAIDVPVEDVQVNGVSVVENGVANLQKASSNNLGVVGIEPQSGVVIASNGKLEINPASTADIKKGENTNKPIVVFKQDAAAFYGLATAAGDTTQSTSSNAVGTYTDEAKAAIRSMIGVENSFSPIATVTKSGKVVTITITDKNGTTTQTITEEDRIFYADYGVTTFDDIENAMNDGKIVICRYEPRSGETIYSPLCSLKSNAPAQARFTIVGSDPNLMCYRFACTALSGWSMDSWKRNAVTRTAQVASGDFIAFADASYNDQIAKSDNLKFGDDPNKYLANNGTWQEVEDGYSPTVTVTDITGGHRVTITDAEHPQGISFDVMNGETPELAVQDVQVNGTSVVTDGVANVPRATNSIFGVVRPHVNTFSFNNDGVMMISSAAASHVKEAASGWRPIMPNMEHAATFYGLTKAAGVNMASSSNAVGQYTESAKSAIHTMLNAPVSVTGTTPTITALSGIQYVCGEVSTLDIALPASGIVDVVFTSGSTPTVLTITPPTGVTLKWANGFDSTALEADTLYELNIKMVGTKCLGVAVGWT